MNSLTRDLATTAPARPQAPRRRGIAALEVALLLPVLAGLLFLLVEGGAMIRTYSAISEASRSAARQVILTGETSGAGDLVQSLLPDLSSGALSTTVTTDSADNSVTVEVHYDYSSYFSSNPLGSSHEPLLTMAAQTSMPLP